MRVRLEVLSLKAAILILHRLHAWAVATNEIEGARHLHSAQLYLNDQYRVLSIEHRGVRM